MDEPTDINDARKKKAAKRANSGKMKSADLYHAIMDAINDTTWNQLEPFPCKLHLLEPDLGTRIVLKELDDGVVIQVKEAHVVQQIMQYTQNELGRLKAYRFTTSTAKAAYDYWLNSTRPIEPPALVSWSDEIGLTYRRLPWVRLGGHTPVWDELVSRMGEQGPAFCAWIGSLFFPASDRQQYLWLYGEGENGKGAITRFLAKVFGRSFRSEQPPKPDDKFWTRWLIGARVVSFPDCNNASFPASGLFKSLTGDDEIRMEIKGGDSFCAPISAKFMFSSNEKPTLSSEKADLRRAIFVALQAITCKPDPAYESRLWEEGGYFLSKCITLYEEEYPNLGRIAVDTEELIAHVATIEERFEVIAAEKFVFQKRENLSQVLRDLPYVNPAGMQSVLNSSFSDPREKSRFLKYLEINHGIIRRKIRLEDGTLSWRYVGIDLKCSYPCS